MQDLSNRTGSESFSLSPRDDSFIESSFDTSGIEDLSYLNLYLESSKEDYKLVNYINSKTNLLTYIKKNKIILQSTHKPDWAYKSNCPFPDHRDSSPSFYVNISTNTFHCFGCSRKGGVCQFLACLQKKQTIDIAKELIAKGQVEVSELVKEAQESYLSKVSSYLDQFAEIHFNFLNKHSFSDEAFEYAANVSPVFEFYIKNILKNNNLDTDILDARFNFCKRKFEEFEE